MEPTLGLLGGNGGLSNETDSSISKVDMSSYPSEAELELGLGLSLGSGGRVGMVKANKGPPWSEYGRILTAKDFPCGFPGRVGGVSGTKRAADCVGPPEVGSASTAVSQVVGWPPIRAYRMNSLVNNQAKTQNAEEEEDKGGVGGNENTKVTTPKKKMNHGSCNDIKEKGHLGFVKVNMDGLPIGRKLDLNAHACYQTLAQALEDMFFKPSTNINSFTAGSGGEKEQVTQSSKLLDGSSEFVLTYEDKEGDWMLVGDVPWRMFLSTVKRLRIMKTSEANGLAPRFQEKNGRQMNQRI